MSKPSVAYTECYRGYTIDVYWDEEYEFDNDPDVLICAFSRRYCWLGGFDSPKAATDYAEERGMYIIPLFAYIHSGVTLRLGHPGGGNPFTGTLPQGHAEFDSGQIGVVLVSKEEVMAFKPEDESEALSCARTLAGGVVSTFNSIASGEVYGYQVSKKSKGAWPTVIDSCWGYVGQYRDMLEEVRATVDRIAHALQLKKICALKSMIRNHAPLPRRMEALAKYQHQ